MGHVLGCVAFCTMYAMTGRFDWHVCSSRLGLVLVRVVRRAREVIAMKQKDSESPKQSQPESEPVEPPTRCYVIVSEHRCLVFEEVPVESLNRSVYSSTTTARGA
jgi:hypothetical protein